jgi:pyrroloquinoline quinone biosynthesis protein E
VVGPEGNAWPCLAAHELPLPPANVREHDLAWIWESSPLFSAFRGTDWMSDPCRSCDRREVDLGGCRCQAFQLTGDMTRTDPVCHLSPDRGLIDAAVAQANASDGPEPVTPGREPVLVPLVSRPHRAD